MNKATKIIIGIIIAIIVIGGIWYGASKKPTPVTEKESIKIGVILPLTGRGASLGENIQNAITLALDKIGNKNIKVIYQDEKGDPKEAISAYQNLRMEGIKVIIGPGFSGGVLAVAPLAEKDKVIILTPSGAADSISDAGDFIFRNNAMVKDKETKLAEFAAKKYSKVATIYDQSVEGLVSAEKIFSEVFTKNGGTIVERQGFPRGETDFRTYLSKIKLKNPEALALFAIMPASAQIIKQIKELGINLVILADDATATETSFLESIGSLAERIIFSGSQFDRSTNPEFWDSYKERFGKEPNIYAAQAYDSFMILMNTIQKCNGIDTECIKNELYKIKNYPGAAGLTSFNEKGDAIKPIIIKTIKNGQFVPYE
jgi:branched-chain amino acid transport system substrate-binding protein